MYVNLEGYHIDAKTFVESSAYSVRSNVDRPSSVILRESQHDVFRKSVFCSGIKSCSSSVTLCSKTHTGVWSPEQAEFNTQNDAPVKAPTQLHMELAKKVFFFAQNRFPLICKQLGCKF